MMRQSELAMASSVCHHSSYEQSVELYLNILTIYIYYISVVCRSVNATDILLIRNIAHPEYKCGQNIEHVDKVNCVNKDRILVYGVLLLQRLTFSVFACMEQC